MGLKMKIDKNNSKFELVKDKVAAITPVPGGVGPMTVAMLMEQTILCACRQNNIDPQEILGEG